MNKNNAVCPLTSKTRHKENRPSIKYSAILQASAPSKSNRWNGFTGAASRRKA
jgi:hypothetical protein